MIRAKHRDLGVWLAIAERFSNTWETVLWLASVPPVFPPPSLDNEGPEKWARVWGAQGPHSVRPRASGHGI